MRARLAWLGGMSGILIAAATARGESPDSPAERGRVAMTLQGYLKPSWSGDAYRNVGKLWGSDAPVPDSQPDAYAAAFNRRYGLHPAPYPNDGLPMGLRRGNGPDGTKTGLAIDCLVCHGGSIGGTSYVGLGNTTVDLKLLFDDLTLADGRKPPPPLITLTTARGTVNAGQVAAVLLSLRNTDLSVRRFPLPLGANLPECDTPPWWRLARKQTMYYDGRTAARSVRTNMQFLLGEKTLQEFKDLEPTFRDIQAYLKSLKPPRYPFPIDPARADRGEVVFETTCTRCHGTYGPSGTYPNKVVPLDVIGTDPARLRGLSDGLVAHYNATWFGGDYRVDPKRTGYQAPPLDGIWATAPFLHNGSVPTLTALLKSSSRPSRFKRHSSTDFEHFDRLNVGWKFEPLDTAPSSTTESRTIYDTSRYGLGNGGHTFGDTLSDDDRMDLIEYLKTL